MTTEKQLTSGGIMKPKETVKWSIKAEKNV
jgi:hypothetical protein